MADNINIIVNSDNEMIICTPLTTRGIIKELYNNGLIVESSHFIEKCDCNDKFNHYQIKYNQKKEQSMKHLFLIIILLAVLLCSSCRRFRLDNINITEDPNQVTIIIHKGLK